MSTKANRDKIISHTLARSVNVIIHTDDRYGTIVSNLSEPIVLNYFFGEPSGDPEHKMAVMVPANGSVTFDLEDGETIDDQSSRRHGID